MHKLYTAYIAILHVVAILCRFCFEIVVISIEVVAKVYYCSIVTIDYYFPQTTATINKHKQAASVIIILLAR